MAFKKIKRWARVLNIGFIMSKQGLDDIAFSTPLLKTFHFISFLNPFRISYSKKTQGERVRHTLEKLGPIFVKFGQLLSTRADLLPKEVITELSKLQDNVPPFPTAIARKMIEKALGQPINEVFDDFSETPLASASIAQVHSAKLKNGQQIIIKVLRPNVHKIMQQDLDLLESLAKKAERFNLIARKIKILELVREAKYHILNELDLTREAASACQLRRNFDKSPNLYVPEVYWDYCYDNVMVMERIYGTQIHNIKQLQKQNVDMQVLAEKGIDIFYTQVFRDCFFHADMHPGNLFVNTTNPKQPSYIAVDFGIMGSLNKDDQYYLAANFLAFFKKDYYEVAKLHVDSGWVAPDTKLEEFEAALRTVCEPLFDRPIQDISFGQTFMRLLKIAQRFEMNIQPQLLMLQKTLLNIEGLARTLFPELDLWKAAKPHLEEWMKKQVGIRSLYNRSKHQWPFISSNLPEVPIMIYEVLKDLKQQQNNIKMQKFITHQQNTSLTNTQLNPSNRLAKLLLGAGIIMVLVGTPLYFKITLDQVTDLLNHTKNWLTQNSRTISVTGIICLAIGYFLKPKKQNNK